MDSIVDLSDLASAYVTSGIGDLSVLFTDREINAHPIMPILKIAGFGVAQEIPANLSAPERTRGLEPRGSQLKHKLPTNCTKLVWDMRWRSKGRYYLPVWPPRFRSEAQA